MKRLLIYFTLLLFLGSCGNSGNGELTGVKGRKRYYQPDPFGMVYIPMGSYTMGLGDGNITYAQLNNPKTVTVQAFYMDQTEITNNEYRQFVYWVRDSIARELAAAVKPDEFQIQPKNAANMSNPPPPTLNWNAKLWDSKDQAVLDALDVMYLQGGEVFFKRKEIDARQLNYSYSYIDLKDAARKDYSQGGKTSDGMWQNRPQGKKDRSVYVRNEIINVFPDTLCWIHDYVYSFNDPSTQNYFWHPAYDNYPVVGVTWKQANAFCIWRTQLKNSFLRSRRAEASVSDFRLPTEAEWEWAARGGYDANPYPWGGPYTRNDKGCFLANFKPMRGDYIVDGGATTVVVAHYPANDFGLYDMAGNVAEWTRSAYNAASYNFTWDLNPDYTYNATDTDPPAKKRKVVRGGSWKDIAYYLRTTTRASEYQDTAKCYIGFRCVQPFLGRQKDDNPARASHVYN